MAQIADKDIANSSGAGVRTDLNNAFPAVATNNFGDKAQAGQILPCEFVADSSTTPKKLLIRSTTGDDGTSGTTPTYFDVGNLDEHNLGLVKRAGDTLTGPLLADDGSGSSSPALSFDGDTDTGIYRVSANTMGFATAGTQRVGISNAGLDMLNALPIRFQDSSGSPFVSLKSPSSLSGNVALTLPSSITNGGFLQTDGSGNLSFQIVNGVPTGTCFTFIGSTAPTGYLKANGDTIPNGSGTVQGVTANFAALYAIVGATLPDLRGEFVRGFDDGRGVDSGRSINSSQGGQNQSHNHTATTTIPDHDHNVDTLNEFTSQYGVWQTSGGMRQAHASGTHRKPITSDASLTATTTINNDGGNEARPRNIAMLYIIKI